MDDCVECASIPTLHEDERYGRLHYLKCAPASHTPFSPSQQLLVIMEAATADSADFTVATAASVAGVVPLAMQPVDDDGGA